MRTVIKECTIGKLVIEMQKLPATTPVFVADEVLNSSDNRVILIFNGEDLDVYSSEHAQKRSECKK